MDWLTFILKALTAIKPRTWLLLAFLAAVVAAQLYLRHKWREDGRSEERVKYEALQTKAAAEMVARDLRNAKAQATAFANGQAIGESRARDQRDNLAAKDRLIGDLRSGNQRLRQLWEGCVSGPQAGDAADLSGGLVRSDELRGEISEQILESDDADSRVARLVEFVQVQQKLCEAVAGP